MKPTLQLKPSQQLKLTPQLQQSIRLLQMSTLDLNQEIERVMQENPLFELVEDRDNADQSSDAQQAAEYAVVEVHVDSTSSVTNNSTSVTDWVESRSSTTEIGDDDSGYSQIADKPLSLREYLNSQICLSQIKERERNVAFLLIDSLDERGYLLQDFDELIDSFSKFKISREDFACALESLQSLDPPGVGARGLQECLLLQLQAKPDDTPYREQAIKVVKEYLEILAAHDFTHIKKLLRCSDQTLRSIRQLITNLNPNPGSSFSAIDTNYIVPDILVTKKNEKWVADLNSDAIPKLSINHLYANILRNKRDESSRGLACQLNEAKWLIKNIHQRSSTILNVSHAIVERQQQFFEHGAVAMRPLVLREIADKVGLHESTISRVTTQKFMRTPRGIFELKFFFGSHVTTDAGGACSATAIRELIKQLIKAENQKKPLSDNRISKLLEEQGIAVARRTVAKYREFLQIPPANLRKSF